CRRAASWRPGWAASAPPQQLPHGAGSAAKPCQTRVFLRGFAGRRNFLGEAARVVCEGTVKVSLSSATFGPCRAPARRACWHGDPDRGITVKLVGVTGGIGMGKSPAAAVFRRAHLPVFDADAVVRRLQAPGGAALPAIAAAFPGTVAETNGRPSLDRG